MEQRGGEMVWGVCVCGGGGRDHHIENGKGRFQTAFPMSTGDGHTSSGDIPPSAAAEERASVETMTRGRLPVLPVNSSGRGKGGEVIEARGSR